MSRRGRLYRQYFTAQECARLDGMDPDSPLHVTNLLRILMTRLLAAAGRGTRTLERIADMLTGFCRSSCTMASLVRIHHKQQGPPPDPRHSLRSMQGRSRGSSCRSFPAASFWLFPMEPCFPPKPRIRSHDLGKIRRSRVQGANCISDPHSFLFCFARTKDRIEGACSLTCG